MKRRTLAFLALPAIAVLVAALTLSLLYPGDGRHVFPARENAPRLAATLQGFEPGSNITYKMLLPEGKAVTGTQVVGEKGDMSLPLAMTGAVPLIYDFSIQEKDRQDPINLTMTFNPGAGEVSLLGDGFDDFTPLELGEGKTGTRTKADWAGVFRHKARWKPGESSDGSFQLAFSGNNIAGDMKPNPKIIKVFTAPGGGGPTSAGVNKYSNIAGICTFSYTGGIPLIPSTCNRPMMELAGRNIVQNYVRAMIMMTHQLAAVMAQAVWTIGPMFDAKQQLETQRVLRTMEAEAKKDYQPSDTMCRIGSFIRSVPRSEEKIAMNKEALNSLLMSAYTDKDDRSTSEGYALDIEARIRQFRVVYCDPRDNNNGLDFMCRHAPNVTGGEANYGKDVPGGIGAITKKPEDNGRKNKDIDYSRTADFPLTLNIDFTDDTPTPDEDDVIALARNLYWPSAMEPAPWRETAPINAPKYMNARQVFAIASVAHNSFIEIAAMKARSDPGLGKESGWNYMKSLMREFGLKDEEIHKYLGDYPSYYAQMEILTKKMYQSPDFYTNLYDKPVNVRRILASMDTLRVMQQRDQLDSRLRQEMLNSLLVEEALAVHAAKINPQLR
jgi:hypothetical protein